MTRTFLHSFDPPSASPITGATVDLDVRDIEDAGLRAPDTGCRLWRMVCPRRAPRTGFAVCSLASLPSLI